MSRVVPFNILVLMMVLTCCTKKEAITSPPPSSTDSIPVKDSVPVTTPPAGVADTLTPGWTKITILDARLLDIDFIDSGTGYAASYNGVYKSSDGGKTWNIPCAGCATSGAYLYAMQDGRVWVGGREEYLDVSNDAGLSYTKSTVGQGWSGADFFMQPNDTAYAIGANKRLITTTDKGLSWHLVDSTVGLSLKAGQGPLYFWSYNTALISDGTDVYHTAGNIKNWEKAGGISDGKSGQGVLFALNDSLVYFLKTSNPDLYLYKSTDAGKTFGLVHTETTNASFADVHFTSPDIGYISFANQVLKTIDGGITWSLAAAIGSGKAIVELDFTDADHGWACGYDGSVLIYKR